MGIYRGYVTEAKDPKEIEENLLPKINELELNLTDDVTFSLEKLYGSILDKHISESNEEGIKSEFIPKVDALKLEPLVARANEFLTDQENQRKLEAEKARLAEEEEKKKAEEEAKKRAEEKRRKEEERKLQELKREEERKKAEEERIKKEKEEEE